jgi:hypothetical protein
MVSYPKHVQAAKDAEQLQANATCLLEAVADAHYRDYLRQRRAQRIRAAREWGVVVMIAVIVLWCVVHWRAS